MNLNSNITPGVFKNPESIINKVGSRVYQEAKGNKKGIGQNSSRNAFQQTY